MQKVKAFGDWLTKWFTAIVIVWAVFNYFVPQASLWGKSYTGYFLGIVLFGMGLTLTLDDFRRILTQPLMVIVGTVAHFVIMPLVAVLLCWIFRLDGALAVGVILVGCCPSGTSSNVMSYLSRGDVALDVSIGILSTLCAPFMIPLLMQWLASQYVSVPVESLFLNAVKVVLFPIALGVICHAIFGEKIEKITVALPIVSQVAILLIIGVVVAANVELVVVLPRCLPFPVAPIRCSTTVRIRVGLRFLQTYVQGISEGLPLCTAESHHLRGRHAGFRFGSDFGADVVRFQSVGRGAVHVLQRLAQHFRFRLSSWWREHDDRHQIHPDSDNGEKGSAARPAKTLPKQLTADIRQ